ncbi:AAA family ATPase [Haliscomenobacter sp.]|uniref:ATP-binding protein n=1 Tax=Haliscomenobacter sp. TaxID=2717303 RepID=UPI0035935220
MARQRLPIGLQDFRSIIEEDYKYIDKTRYIHKMVTSGKYFFLSRPRRFGKSITIATLQELFLGSKELFKGLWIEDKWDWAKKHPVLRISFTSIGYESLGLEAALEQELHTQAEKKEIQLKKAGIGPLFKELLEALAKQGKVVVLIDEYDAPIINFLGRDLEKAIQNRNLLREFYTILKDMDANIELVFLTGVSKFSKVGIFSGLNNLRDLTMDAQYATMLGYTQEELESNFVEEIELAAEKLKLSRIELLEQMRVWYNGYRFEEDAVRVYNPVSTNLFFEQQKFLNFWFATGTPSFLVNILKAEGVFDLHFPATSLSGFESFELDQIKPVALLFQTGYLTIQSKDEDGLVSLDYPNKEVRDSMLEVLIEGFVGVDAELSAALIIKIRNAFRANDLERVIQILQEVFKKLPYFLHEHYPEKFFHAAIHLLFSYLGIRIHSEVCTSDGRIDSLVETDTHIYILEYKLDKSAQVALEQIKQKRYYQAYWNVGKPVVGVGVNFSSESKNIEGWVAAVVA